MSQKLQLPAPEVDTGVQDWASEFISRADKKTKHILRASVTSEYLARYIAGVANSGGGYVFVGAYSEQGIGTGYEDVSETLIENAKKRLKGVKFVCERHTPRYQSIYFFKIGKSDSIAFADEIPYILENGTPKKMSEKLLIERLGLGIDSSLINMLAEQISSQSQKIEMQSTHIDTLTSDLKERSKLKNQIPGFVAGGIVGWLLTTGLNQVLGIA